MKTECTEKRFEFQPLGRREIVADFNGGTITSDGGGQLLREVEKRTNILGRFEGLAGSLSAKCVTDHRNQDLIEHSVLDLVSQRVFAIALGYEDLNDHDELARDQFLAAMVGKTDPTGDYRLLKRDKGHALAGKSTLNRLELTPEDADEKSRYKKIVMNSEAIDMLLIDTFIESYPEAPEQIILDVDAQRTFLCTVNRKNAFSMGTTTRIATCRFIFSVATSYSMPGCDQPISMAQQGRQTNSNG